LLALIVYVESSSAELQQDFSGSRERCVFQGFLYSMAPRQISENTTLPRIVDGVEACGIERAWVAQM
jgi:hypothetical protein